MPTRLGKDAGAYGAQLAQLLGDADTTAGRGGRIRRNAGRVRSWNARALKSRPLPSRVLGINEREEKKGQERKEGSEQAREEE